MTNRNELLIVSFGTTSAESRELNIGAVEQSIADAAGDSFSICRCFTSQTVINIIKKREGICIDNIQEALESAADHGVRNLAVQPLHLMKGLEYGKLQTILSGYGNQFQSISLGDPLLSSEDDFRKVAEALIEASSEYDDGETALVFMGHGTEAAANDIYIRLQEILSSMEKHNYYIGTVEARPSVGDVLSDIDKCHYRRAVLRPLMLVAGNHAVRDMASGDDPDSWFSLFTASGYETECIIEGLGQIPAIRDIYVSHAMKAIQSLNSRTVPDR